MSGIFIGLVLYAIISRALDSRKNEVGKSRIKTPSGYIQNAIFYWFLILILTLFTLALTVGITKANVICLFLLLSCPYLLAQLPIYLGRVKLSVSLTNFSYILFGPNVFAGSIFSGYLAAKKIKDNNERHSSLLWLKERFLRNRSDLYSGEIITFVLIDAALTHPNNNEYLVRRLSLLGGLAGKSIPKPIILYVLKRSLAHTLPSNNWSEVMKVVSQWHAISPTMLSSIIDGFYHYKHESVSYKKWKYFLIYCLNAWRYPVVRRWCLANNPNQNSNDNEVVLSRAEAIEKIWLEEHKKVQIDRRTQDSIISILESDMPHWVARAKEIGDWENDTIEVIANQVKDLYRKESVGLSEEQRNELDEKHNAINYIIRNITNRRQLNNYKNPAEEAIDFIQFLSAFDELKEYDSAQMIAFSQYYRALWNWMANLFNNQKEYSLSYFICQSCLPYAENLGDEEFLKSVKHVIES